MNAIRVWPIAMVGVFQLHRAGQFASSATGNFEFADRDSREVQPSSASTKRMLGAIVVTRKKKGIVVLGENVESISVHGFALQRPSDLSEALTGRHKGKKRNLRKKDEPSRLVDPSINLLT
jgi:hypothetical protein